MRGVTFRCPDDREEIKIDSVVMGETEVLLVGTCECCGGQVHFQLSKILTQLIVPPQKSRYVN